MMIGQISSYLRQLPIRRRIHKFGGPIQAEIVILLSSFCCTTTAARIYGQTNPNSNYFHRSYLKAVKRTIANKRVNPSASTATLCHVIQCIPHSILNMKLYPQIAFTSLNRIGAGFEFQNR